MPIILLIQNDRTVNRDVPVMPGLVTIQLFATLDLK